jgi:hypothetical protein
MMSDGGGCMCWMMLLLMMMMIMMILMLMMMMMMSVLVNHAKAIVRVRGRACICVRECAGALMSRLLF